MFFVVVFLSLSPHLSVTGGSNGNEQEDPDQNNVMCCKRLLFIYIKHFQFFSKKKKKIPVSDLFSEQFSFSVQKGKAEILAAQN